MGNHRDDILVKDLYPYITKNINKKNVKKIVVLMSSFIDKNNGALMTPYPIERIHITDKLKEGFYDLLEIDPNLISSMINEIPLVKLQAMRLKNNHFLFTLLMLAKYMYDNKYVKEHKLVDMFMFIHAYALFHKSIIPFIQKETMIYTVNSLNDKHDLKKSGSVLNTIIKKTETFEKKYYKVLESKSDFYLIKNYIETMNTRIRQWIKTILTEYRLNKESGRYFNSETDSYGEDDYRDTTNTMMEIDKISNNVVKNIFSFPIDKSLVNIVKALTLVSRSTLISTLEDIREEGSMDDIFKIVRSILVIYVVTNKNKITNIKSKNYINSVLLIYNKSNTKDKNVIEVKSTLDTVLSAHNKKYNDTNRVATRINWRRAVYLYYALLIQEHS